MALLGTICSLPAPLTFTILLFNFTVLAKRAVLSSGKSKAALPDLRPMVPKRSNASLRICPEGVAVTITPALSASNKQCYPTSHQPTEQTLLAQDPDAINKITDDQFDLLNDLSDRLRINREDLATEPEGFLNETLDELKTQLDTLQTDLNRRREYGKMGFIAETGYLGTGDAVTYNYMFDEGLDFDMVRLPTGKGEIRGAQGRLYKINRATGEAIPDVGTWIRRPFNEDAVTLAPQRIKEPDANRVIQRFHKTMSELGNLEDTLQVHYLSKIDDSVDDILNCVA